MVSCGLWIVRNRDSLYALTFRLGTDGIISQEANTTSVTYDKGSLSASLPHV